MNGLIVVFGGILGIIIGSFLNVVILRINTGRGIGGRSHCMSCNKTLVWYELIPVVSFIFQGGKCSKCHLKISMQYPLVEFTTGILFAITIACFFTPIITILWLLLVCIGMVIAVYDIHHKIIHIQSLIAFFIVSFLLIGYQNILGHFVSGFFVGLPFFILWLISRGRWIGFGDVEIITITGLLLGTIAGFSAVTIGFWTACFVIIPWYVIMKFRKKTINHQIPMGPFLLLGIWLVGVCGLDVFNFFARMI